MKKIVVHDEILAWVGLALRRAAKRAGEVVAQTNTPLAVYENVKVVKEKLRKRCNVGHDCSCCTGEGLASD